MGPKDMTQKTKIFGLKYKLNVTVYLFLTVQYETLTQK